MEESLYNYFIPRIVYTSTYLLTQKMRTMKFVEKIAAFFRGEGKIDSNSLITADVCPNCWGKQEYNGEIKKYIKIKDSLGKKAFVAKFVETHLDGIKLEKNADTVVCKKCNTKAQRQRAQSR